MVPTKARSPIRQYLPSEHHKWGYKIWARYGVSGIFYDVDVYIGKNDKLDENLWKNFGKVGAIVLKLTDTLPKYVNHKVFIDDLFSSVRLFEHLKDDGILSV